MPSKPRVIVHLDLDAFFASVEVLEDPRLEGKPVLVGGKPESRGVVASAAYAARAFGVRSAMPTALALRLCPAAIVLPPRHHVYRAYSHRVMRLLEDASPLMEQMSVDEAFLDLSDRVESWAGGAEVAKRLQLRVRQEVGLSASLGVATNKLVAKVASDRDKPHGLTLVLPGEEAGFLAPLPVQVLWGVGPVTARKLTDMGISTVADLASTAEELLKARFGRHGAEMARQAKGVDDRPVMTEHKVKTVSQERTFARDLADADSLRSQLWRLSQEVSQRLRSDHWASGTIAIKVRYSDFSTHSRQASLPVPTDDPTEVYRLARMLFDRVWQGGRAVRLLGISCRQLSVPAGQIPLLLDDPAPR